MVTPFLTPFLGTFAHYNIAILKGIGEKESGIFFRVFAGCDGENEWVR